MFAKIVLTLFTLIFTAPFIMNAQQSDEFQLDDYQWKNRLVLIFAPAENNRIYKEQIEELNSSAEGMRDRDLKVFHLFREGASFGDEKQLNNSTVDTLYNKFKVEPGNYLIILIGKDGTEKLRKSSLLKTEKLFALIDSMPMRQREMQNDGK